MWDSFRGCKDSFNLSIPPCPQQLLETEGFKTPWAETHKSRLSWNEKGEEIGGGRQAQFSITNRLHGKGLDAIALKPCQSFLQGNQSLGEGTPWACNVGHLLHCEHSDWPPPSIF